MAKVESSWRPRKMTRNSFSVQLLVLAILALPGSGACRKSESPPEAKPEAKSLPASPPEKPVDIPTRVEIPIPIDESDRWLFVRKVAEKSKGGWVTGSFDADRNKLRITTSEVEEFSLDTSRVRIDWQKLVVLSIDGRNSELRKRDLDILHFVRSVHGEWTVREP